MKKHSMKKMLRSIVCMVLIAAMALACMGCAKKEEPKTESPAASSGVQELGEGAKTFAFYMHSLSAAGNGVAGAGMSAAAALLMFVPNVVLFVSMQSRVMSTMAHSGLK